jgi:hypothetical protein
MLSQCLPNIHLVYRENLQRVMHNIPVIKCLFWWQRTMWSLLPPPDWHMWPCLAGRAHATFGAWKLSVRLALSQGIKIFDLMIWFDDLKSLFRDLIWFKIIFKICDLIGVTEDGITENAITLIFSRTGKRYNQKII